MRSAKATGNFPYSSKRVCYIAVDHQGNVSQISNSHSDISAAHKNAMRETIKIFAVWPGDYRSDLFVIDDLDALADAFGVDRPDDHIHRIKSSLSPYDDGKSPYANVKVIFECGCNLDQNNIKKIANDLNRQKGWVITTSTPWSSGTNGAITEYYLRVRRSSYK